MPDNYDLNTFQNESIDSCADGNCGRSVVTNANDNDGDCCIPGPQGPEGPAGKTGPAGPIGAAGRPPVIRCGCLPTNETDGGSNSPIQQECIDDLKGRVVISNPNIDYYGAGTTSNGFYQVNCSPATFCGYFNVTNPNQQTPPLGSFTGNLGSPSVDINGDKNIVAWGYIGTGDVPNINYTWSYGDFKKLNGLNGDKLTASTGGVSKFTFMPTDPLFAGGGTINLTEFKNLVGGTPSEELTAAFLDDFPQCATDGTGTPPSGKNGQGASICSNLSSPCDCTGCDENNRLTSCDGLQAGDMFVDACNKVMYIRGSEDWPTDGIPFDEGADCPACPSCPDCPGCPECPPQNCKECPCECNDILPPQICNCVGLLSGLVGTDCNCPGGLGPPKCPRECSNGNGVFYQDEAKECGCDTNQTYVGCVDCKQEPTIICECPEGKTAGCCETCPPPKTCAELDCCTECPTPTCESLGCPCPPADQFGNCGCPPSPIGGCTPTLGCCIFGDEYDICLPLSCCGGPSSFTQNGALLLGE
jgi:hypothetical protein